MKSSSILAFGLLASLVGCSSPPPIQIASQVDLPRFMGDWYVIANIPTFIETEAFNAIESYRRNEDGTIAKLRKLRIVKSYIKTVEKKRKITKAKLIESQK